MQTSLSGRGVGVITMLQVRNLRLSFNGNAVINDLSMDVRQGEIHGILGENGTGKTSIAYLIMGVSDYKPTGGEVLFEGKNITNLSISERAKKGISLAWQEPVRIEGLSVVDYLKLSGNGSEIKKIKHYLRMVGMEPERYLDRDIDSTLSGGERKRIELASILAMHPKLAILDEPDSGIDIVSLPFLLNGIKEMNKRGSSVLLITHSERVAKLAHRVSILCDGRILRTGPPAEICSWFKDNCRRCGHINEPLEIE